MTHRVVRVTLSGGLRSRPAAMFVSAANRYSSQLLLESGNKKINAKSIMGVLALGASEGDEMHIYASGSDEEAAAQMLADLLTGVVPVSTGA